MNKLLALIEREPVRAYIYTALAAVLALLAALGKLDGNLIPAILSTAATVLAVERARSVVTPVDKDEPTE